MSALLLRQAWVLSTSFLSGFHFHLKVLTQDVHFLLQVQNNMICIMKSFQLLQCFLLIVYWLESTKKVLLKYSPSFKQAFPMKSKILWLVFWTDVVYLCNEYNGHRLQLQFLKLPKLLTFNFASEFFQVRSWIL